MTNPTERIAQQNDYFRKTWGGDDVITGKIVATPGVVALGFIASLVIEQEIQRYDAFDPENDPEGEHNFGAITIHIDAAPIKIWWKIDLYDLNFQHGSEARDDPAQTRRVLTILLPSEH